MSYARLMRLLTCLIVVFLAPATAPADIYRSVDENGNIVFSDTPSEGAEKIDVEEAQTVESPRTKPFKYEPPESEPAPPYKQVAIISPENDKSVRANSGDISVKIAVNPALRLNHQLEVLMDGNQVASGRAMSVDLENVARGTHTLQARVIARNGKTIMSSEPVTFHLLRHSVQHPNPPAGPLNPPGGPVN